MARLRILRPTPAKGAGFQDRLDSWKEIAAYFNRGVRTVQRWERDEELPIHRLRHDKKGSVYALRRELDAWWESRRDSPPDEMIRPAPVVAPYPHPSSRRLVMNFTLAGLAVAAVAVVWYFGIPAAEPTGAPQVSPLTAYPGEEWHPSISPDRQKVTFTRKLAGHDNYDIFVKQLGVETPVPLTDTPAQEGSAVWSPDGSHIVFARGIAPGVHAILRTPLIGGSEEKLCEVSGPVSEVEGKVLVGCYMDWSPNGRWLVVLERNAPDDPFGLMAFSLETRRKHRLTTPPTGSMGDVAPSFSPDGSTIAFHRVITGGLSEIFMVEVTEDLQPKGSPQQLTFENGHATSPTWTADGEELVFSLGTLRRHQPELYRMAASPRADLQRLDYAGPGAYHPQISQDGHTLVFARHAWDINISQLDLSTANVAGTRTDALSSTAVDLQPTYSPDGNRIAFSSERSGSRQIWVSNADGSDQRKLTSWEGTHSSGPSWSPDGNHIAFSSDQGGNRDVYLIEALGGQPERLTTDPANDNSPIWSVDGRLIYFSSNRGGTWQIWKMAASGGEAVQVTTTGGTRPRMAVGGEFLYYAKQATVPTPIWRIPAEGGTEEEVLGTSAAVDQFTISAAGIYFTPVPAPFGPRTLMFQGLYSGSGRAVARLEDSSLQCSLCMDWEETGLTVSPDGCTILYGQVDGFGSDLMLVSNFQ